MKVKVDPTKADKFHQAEDFIPEKEYIVLTIEGNVYRLNSFEGPARYPKEMFVITDPNRPSDWVTDYLKPKGIDEIYEYSRPPELCEPFSFEAYFDNKAEAVQIFNAYIERLGLPFDKIVTPEGRVKTIRRSL